MTIIIHHSGNSQDIEPLNFELAGVFDITAALALGDPVNVMDFLTNGHPGAKASQYKPGMVLSVDPELKEKGHNNVPFGVFLATQEANPHSDRPLRSRASLQAYQEAFHVLIFDENWSDWPTVAEHIQRQTTDDGLALSLWINYG